MRTPDQQVSDQAMAFSSPQKQGAVASAAVGALALAGVAVSTLGPSSAPAGAGPVAAAAVPEPDVAGPDGSGATSSTISVTAKADNARPAEDTVFTISGEVMGAQPGAKIRLQRQQTPTETNASPAWSTLAYTTFTDKNNKFSFPVKMETSGSYNLRVLHPQDNEGPASAFSNPFAVTVSTTDAKTG
jgi:hypothetical protein